MGTVARFSQIEIAVYKGDNFITSGKIQKVAEELGIKAETLYFYSMPSYLKRLTQFKKSTSGQNVRRVIRIDKGGDDE